MALVHLTQAKEKSCRPRECCVKPVAKAPTKGTSTLLLKKNCKGNAHLDQGVTGRKMLAQSHSPDRWSARWLGPATGLFCIGDKLRIHIRTPAWETKLFLPDNKSILLDDDPVISRH